MAAAVTLSAPNISALLQRLGDDPHPQAQQGPGVLHAGQFKVGTDQQRLLAQPDEPEMPGRHRLWIEANAVVANAKLQVRTGIDAQRHRHVRRARMPLDVAQRLFGYAQQRLGALVADIARWSLGTEFAGNSGVVDETLEQAPQCGP